MSDTFTQKDYNDACDEMVKTVNFMIKESGHKSITAAIANGNNELLNALYYFQEQANPSVEEIGLKTMSLSELFGIDIVLTVN